MDIDSFFCAKPSELVGKITLSAEIRNRTSILKNRFFSNLFQQFEISILSYFLITKKFKISQHSANKIGNNDIEQLGK